MTGSLRALTSFDEDLRIVPSCVQLNAIRHSCEHVVVSLELRSGGVSIHVDDGSGIPVDERARIWDAFTRLDDSRSRAHGGTGLGLAIVKRILAWHGGSVAATESPMGGARFTTVWPCSSKAPFELKP